jgi:hypothetical protein
VLVGKVAHGFGHFGRGTVSDLEAGAVLGNPQI